MYKKRLKWLLKPRYQISHSSQPTNQPRDHGSSVHIICSWCPESIHCLGVRFAYKSFGSLTLPGLFFLSSSPSSSLPCLSRHWKLYWRAMWQCNSRHIYATMYTVLLVYFFLVVVVFFVPRPARPLILSVVNFDGIEPLKTRFIDGRSSDLFVGLRTYHCLILLGDAHR